MFKNQPYNRATMPAITKENPYIQVASQKIKSAPRKSNNRKGVGLVVARIGSLTFAKYRIVKQNIKNGLVVNSILTN